MSESKELTAIAPTAGGRIEPMIPRTMEELKYVAGLVIKAQLAPDSYKGDPSKIALGIMKGMEVGLAPLTALSVIAIINNRPTIWGDGAIALAQGSGTLDRLEESEIGTRPAEGAEVSKFGDDYGVEVRAYRKGQSSPYIGRFTVGDAKRAKLWMNPSKAPWMLYPKRMLRQRAIGFALRNGFADCLAGMMIREEVEDFPAPPAKIETSFLDDTPPAIDGATEEPAPDRASQPPYPAPSPEPTGQAQGEERPGTPAAPQTAEEWKAWVFDSEVGFGTARTVEELDEWAIAAAPNLRRLREKGPNGKKQADRLEGLWQAKRDALAANLAALSVALEA